jgi:hypothetical protein
MVVLEKLVDHSQLLWGRPADRLVLPESKEGVTSMAFGVHVIGA